MITDAYNTLTVSTGTLASGSSVYSTDAIDLRLNGTATTTGDIGEGTTLYVSLFITTTFAGSGGATANIEVGFATDAAGTSFGNVWSSGATAFGSIPAATAAGAPGVNSQTGHFVSFSVQPLKAGGFNPYLLLKITGGGGANLTAGTVRAHIALEPYDAKQIGLYASGYTVL